MDNRDVIKELRNMAMYNYTLAPKEVFRIAIQSVKVVETLSALIKSGKMQNVSIEQLKQVLDEYMEER